MLLMFSAFISNMTLGPSCSLFEFGNHEQMLKERIWRWLRPSVPLVPMIIPLSNCFLHFGGGNNSQMETTVCVNDGGIILKVLFLTFSF